MPLYEHVFLARQDISAQQVEGLMETFKSVITDNGGKVEKTEYWGLKSLAYKIKKKRKAHYALMNLDAPHEAVAEMERQMRIENDIIRFLTLRVDQHEEEPSAMTKRPDRDDRRGPRAGGRDGPSKPYNNPEKPAAAPSKPVEAAPSKPVEAAPSKPVEAAPSKPVEAAPTEEDAT